MTASDVLGKWQDPEYTGENRCLPCTVFNALAAVLLAVTLSALSILAGAPGIVPFVTAATLGIAAVAIYFKGYLIPGTPTLTKRYFPPWLLGLFGKQPEVSAGVADAPAGTDGSDAGQHEDLDVEGQLLAIGAVSECRGGEDLCLTDDFEADWNESIDDAREADEGRGRLLDLLGADEDEVEGDVEVEEHGGAFRVRHDGRYVGTWESRAAFLADVAAAELLETRVEGWDRLTLGQRGRLLNGLRLFVRTCPECGGEVDLGVETVESCCSSREVAALTCEGCGARLLETRGLPDEAAA